MGGITTSRMPSIILRRIRRTGKSPFNFNFLSLAKTLTSPFLRSPTKINQITSLRFRLSGSSLTEMMKSSNPAPKSSVMASAAAMALLLATATIQAQTLLFADNFDRPDATDLNAAVDGKSGSLGALDWIPISNLNRTAIVANQLVGGDDGAAGGFDFTYLDHNFTDAVISSGGSFSVSLDLVGFNGLSGGTRFMGIAVGHSKAEADAWSTNNPVSFDSDFFVGIDQTGVRRLVAFENAVAQPDVPFDIAGGGQTLRVVFTNFTNFNAGTTVGYEVLIDDTSFGTGTFQWSGTNENYLGLYANVSQSGAVFDNFVVEATAEAIPLVLEIQSNTDDFDFEWRSEEGVQYDLVSSTDLSTDPSTWDPYNDGVNPVYENIPSEGATTTLTGVMKDEDKRFFALIKKDAP